MGVGKRNGKPAEKVAARGKGKAENKQPCTKHQVQALGRRLIAWLKEAKDNVFWQEFLVLEEGYLTEEVLGFCRAYPEFERVLRLAEEIQQVKLLKMGGNDTRKSLFALNVLHGLKEGKGEDKTAQGEGEVVPEMGEGLSEEAVMAKIREITG